MSIRGVELTHDAPQSIHWPARVIPLLWPARLRLARPERSFYSDSAPPPYPVRSQGHHSPRKVYWMKRRILLVDDDVAVLLTFKAVLEISGFEVDTAASAREGKARIR